VTGLDRYILPHLICCRPRQRSKVFSRSSSSRGGAEVGTQVDVAVWIVFIRIVQLQAADMENRVTLLHPVRALELVCNSTNLLHDLQRTSILPHQTLVSTTQELDLLSIDIQHNKVAFFKLSRLPIEICPLLHSTGGILQVSSSDFCILAPFFAELMRLRTSSSIRCCDSVGKQWLLTCDQLQRTFIRRRASLGVEAELCNIK